MGTARYILVIPACAALVWLASGAVRLGFADTTTHESLRTMASWSARNIQPPLAEWLAVRNNLDEAALRSPNDPALHETLGVLLFQRAGTFEFVGLAHEKFVASLGLRPTSPYAWASVAAARYAQGKTDALFEVALVNAIALGPSEAEVQWTVADLGLAVWDDVSDATRRSIRTAIAAGMQRDPLGFLQVSQRRGRLDPACRHVAGNKRITDTKWVNLCEGRGTT
ncbi:tetratricopeptide repeat protein [Usitatibacter palustris]|uniref:Uncharacterized protein n=1 Tax=Usitatibacter palustris TaxID=2732487 RepID=A0A6M4H7X5_9PROT|nr:hypothetical protein [Usitatibacter palustris]QJR15670.1 hypothetical protein DSM104440_02495 [Usitatibacter palustris]